MFRHVPRIFHALAFRGSQGTPFDYFSAVPGVKVVKIGNVANRRRLPGIAEAASFRTELSCVFRSFTLITQSLATFACFDVEALLFSCLSFFLIFYLWIGVDSADVMIAIMTACVVHFFPGRRRYHRNAIFSASGIVWLTIVPK